MRPLILFTLFAALTISGRAAEALKSSAVTPTTGEAKAKPDLSPVEAIRGAAEAKDGITATFKMEVKSGGWKEGSLYLNSELNFRDPQCLILVLAGDVARELRVQLDGDPLARLKGRNVKVTGTAKRVTLPVISNGAQSAQGSYRTQVEVTEVPQISVVP